MAGLISNQRVQHQPSVNLYTYKFPFNVLIHAFHFLQEIPGSKNDGGGSIGVLQRQGGLLCCWAAP